MKNQASVSLTIVDEPINGNANTGQILIRATSDGVIAVDANGKQTPLGGQQYTINNIAADASGNFVITASDLNAAEATHTHVINDITNLQTTLDNKAPVTHTHNMVTGLTANDNYITGDITLIEGDNVQIETYSNNIEFNVNVQAAGAAAAMQNLATANNSTVKVFIGTQSEWDAFTKESGTKYLVYILEG